ncbi:putative copper resistance protein D [Sphingobium faniae]|nr:putative copper resistance protein D [Sphingobium faniae]
MTDSLIVAIRWALYIDLGLLFGLPLFALYALGGDESHGRYLALKPTVFLLALAGVAISLFGFALQTAAMAGVAVWQIDRDTVAMVLRETPLGLALQVRGVALAVILFGISLYAWWSRPAQWIWTIGGGVALATLAWSGHSAAGTGSAGWSHLAAGILHLLAAGAWLGAILAFLVLISGRKASSDITRIHLAHRALEGFAIVGTVVVAVIVATGLINSLFLVGPEHVLQLGTSLYGQILIAKLALFAAMLAMAAVNRYRLSPALGRALESGGEALAIGRLRKSLLMEGGMALAIFALVGWLGTLSPPMAA